MTSDDPFLPEPPRGSVISRAIDQGAALPALTLTPSLLPPAPRIQLSLCLEPRRPCPVRRSVRPPPLCPQETGNNEVLFMHLDLASLRSVRAFASTFLRQEPQLHLLINNAGEWQAPPRAATDGFSLPFQVNHLGHFLLTQLLLERLRSCAPSRVVIVASSAHCAGRLRPEALGQPPSGLFSTFQDYCDSKLANVLHARELATRELGTQVTCYAVHPGFVNTSLFRHAPLWLRPLLLPLAWLLFLDAAEGARAVLDCATRDGLEPLSGRYFTHGGPRVPWPAGRDDRLARELWEGSERLVVLLKLQAALWHGPGFVQTGLLLIHDC
uniref:Dehydrogenase/reductase 13 n=1 Tax=Serinus canaria TaxID=9135 RepID=A0A8C9MXW9_SERCA